MKLIDYKSFVLCGCCIIVTYAKAFVNPNVKNKLAIKILSFIFIIIILKGQPFQKFLYFFAANAQKFCLFFRFEMFFCGCIIIN